MPRRAASFATALIAVAPACVFVAGLLEHRAAPVADAAHGAVERPDPVDPTGLPAVSGPPLAPASGAKRYPVIIRHPTTLGVLDTELRDVRGAPVGVACGTCHASGAHPPIAAREGAPEGFHAGVKLSHGALSCNSCHDPAERTRLRLADGTSLALAEVMRLCGQCHGPQFRDYERGSHGGMAGYWDLERGSRVRNSCVACHAAHEPAYPRVVPAPPPRDRFLPHHPDPRPSPRLPGREPHGAETHG